SGNQWLKPAEDHALAVERHVLAHRFHSRIGHELFMARVGGFLVRPDDPREDYPLTFFEGHSAAEIRLLAIRHINFPRLNLFERAIVVDDRPELFCDVAIGILLVGRNWNDETLNIHPYSPDLCAMGL